LTRGRGPLADSYPAAVALVICALVPFLMLSAAVFPLAPLISKSLGLSMPILDVTIGLSDAAYAFGTVLAVQFAVHLPARRMLLGYVTVFVVAAVLAAWAPNGLVFAVAFIIEGLCTSLMLIAAVPPLVTGWPTAKMPRTGLIMNLCIFGAVALGPTIGGLQAASGTWRPLFWGVAAVGGFALLLSLLTYEDAPAQDRSAPWDIVAVTLAGCGCAAAFFGAAKLQGSGPEPSSLGPLLAGVAMIVALVIYQYRSRSPLMPVRQPVLLYLATAIGTSQMAGIRASVWICLLIAAGGALLVTVLFVLGGGRLRTPDLERWAGGEPAWTSPPLLGRLRQPPAPEEHPHRPSVADVDARSGRV
jgi:MFS family permease